MEPLSIRRNEWSWAVVVAVCVVALASLPYLVVYLATPSPGGDLRSDLRFVGTLLNPLDGDTYLAKMQAGAQGDWLFHLPYTAQDHPGAFVLTHYLALGHLAAWLRWPIPLVYHLARVAAGFALLLVVYALITRLTRDLTERRIAFLFVALSSGLGWLATMFGHLGASDLYIPESNTFYSLHINPHFPIAMALMVGMFLAVGGLRSAVGGQRSEAGGQGPEAGRTVGLVLMSLSLSIVQPFAVVTVYLALGVDLFLRWRRDGRMPWPVVWTIVIAGAATLPLMIYTFWITQADPVLRGWMAQNVTPSPPVWDYALGYGLILALAVPGAVVAARRKSDGDLMLLAWVGVTALLLYTPFALQRRFSLGLHVPLAILAAMGLFHVAGRVSEKRRNWMLGATLAATLPTTVLVILLALGGGLTRNPRLFVSADEAMALDWLRDHTPRGAVVLASPEMGLFVPAWSGRRVVYGHPFETVDAERTKARVEAFFAAGTSDADRAAMLRDWRVAFVFVGPRERALGSIDWPGREVFRNASVTVYQP